jgi:hypothetical protein
LNTSTLYYYFSKNFVKPTVQPVFLNVSKVYKDPFPSGFNAKDDDDDDVNRTAPKLIEEALNPIFAFPIEDDDDEDDEDNGFDISGCFYDDGSIDIERYFFD